MPRLATAYGRRPASPTDHEVIPGVLYVSGPAGADPNSYGPYYGPENLAAGPSLLTGRSAVGGSAACQRATQQDFNGGSAFLTTIGYAPAARRLARDAKLCFVELSGLANEGDVADALALRSDELAAAGVTLAFRTGARLANDPVPFGPFLHPYTFGLPLRPVASVVELAHSYAASGLGAVGYLGRVGFTFSALAAAGGGRFSLVLASTEAGRVIQTLAADGADPYPEFALPKNEVTAGYFAVSAAVDAVDPFPAYPDGVAVGTYDYTTVPPVPPPSQITSALYALPDRAAADAAIVVAHAARFDRYAINWVSGPENRNVSGSIPASVTGATYSFDILDAATVYEPVRPAGVDYSYQFADSTDAVLFADAIIQKAIDDLT